MGKGEIVAAKKRSSLSSKRGSVVSKRGSVVPVDSVSSSALVKHKKKVVVERKSYFEIQEEAQARYRARRLPRKKIPPKPPTPKPPEEIVKFTREVRAIVYEE